MLRLKEFLAGQRSEGQAASRLAGRIAGIYAALGTLWIIGSDRLLQRVVPDPGLSATLQTVKGWFYVAATSVILYLLVRQAIAAIERTSAAVRQRERELAVALEQTAKFKFMVDGASEEVYLADAEGRLAYVNAAAARSLGYSPAELLERSVPDIDPGFDLPRWRTHYAELAARGPAAHEMPTLQVVHKRKDGSLVHKETKPVHLVLGGRGYVCGFARDVTQRLRLESELRQSQKMEAIGRLAGGVAHDFNNLLTVISGYGTLLAGRLGTDGEIRRDVGEIHRDFSEIRRDVDQMLRAADRAADLTRQLLAFSRKQWIEPRVLDLNELVRSSGKMLQRLIGEDVSLVLHLGDDVGQIRADPGQIEQAVLNLAVNARDAMPVGGRLTLTTERAELELDSCRRVGPLQAGPVVCLVVSDTGTGMSDEVQSHLFEPFYTTKDAGKGTGLGLSTVYGVVQQAGGCIEVTSQLGQGTTFRLCFPRTEAQAAVEPVLPPPATAGGRETVLLVEDEPVVRRLFSQYLSTLGYQVLEAGSGPMALAVAASHDGPIDLLLTDVVMPGFSGVELATRLKAARPGVRVLFVSGYSDSASHADIVRSQAAYLQKPVTREVFVAKVRAVLDGAAGEAQAGAAPDRR